MKLWNANRSDGLLTVPATGPAPRVFVNSTGAEVSIEPVPNDLEDLAEWRRRYLAAFGTTDETIAEALFQQLLNALNSDPMKPLEGATANLALALLHSIGPKDTIEAMLASQMIVVNIAAMDASRLALHTQQTPGGRQAYLSLARKLMSLFTTQMDALNRHRGKGVVQKVVVEKVHIAPGGQAVVGAVSSGGRGGGR